MNVVLLGFFLLGVFNKRLPNSSNLGRIFRLLGQPPFFERKTKKKKKKRESGIKELF
jgi:hypothetical protein